MSQHWSIDLIWWISAVELPVLAGLFWLVWKTRRDLDEAMDGERAHVQSSLIDLREALSAYKLEVAKSYASIGYIKDIERRLTEHLVRIEAKLDGAQAHLADRARL
ncbi:MAG: hypothetical protein HQL43_07185 [Alphaproteobacteria bacterium]|nr:hypothetical protein [Alphaproteobacteria bacterium]